MNMDCIIKVERDSHMEGTDQARKDWATIGASKLALKAPVFYDVARELRYTDIVGGIAYPCVQFPGIIIIVGIMTQSERVVLKVIEVFESRDVFEIFKQAVLLREKYGYRKDQRILPQWTGEPDKFLPLVARLSAKLEKEIGSEAGLYIKYPIDIDTEKNPFPVFVREILTALQNEELDLGEFTTLRRYLQELPPSAAEEGRIQDYPAVGLIGAIIHSAMEERPWEILTEDDGNAFHLPFN